MEEELNLTAYKLKLWKQSREAWQRRNPPRIKEEERQFILNCIDCEAQWEVYDDEKCICDDPAEDAWILL